METNVKGIDTICCTLTFWHYDTVTVCHLVLESNWFKACLKLSFSVGMVMNTNGSKTQPITHCIPLMPIWMESVYPWSQLLSDSKKQKFSFWTYLNCASFYKSVSTVLFPPVSSIYYLEVIVMHQVYCLSASIMPMSNYLSLSLISYLIWCMFLDSDVLFLIK